VGKASIGGCNSADFVGAFVGFGIDLIAFGLVVAHAYTFVTVDQSSLFLLQFYFYLYLSIGLSQPTKLGISCNYYHLLNNTFHL